MTNENTFQSGGTTAAESEVEHVQKRAQGAVEDLKSAGAAMAADYQDKAQQAWGNAKAQARTWQEDGEDYVRENPLTAVLVMAGIGFVLGLISRR